MGGAVGLKGTDGETVLKKAQALGAKPTAHKRADVFLSELERVKNEFQLVTGAGKMGEHVVRKRGFSFSTIGKRKDKTAAEDTKEIARNIKVEEIDLLVFCGGDGTARDILDVVNTNIPVLGVPTGVKMHSAVFAVNPKAAARIASRFLWEGLPLKEVEIMDVDETAFRKGRLSAQLYGYLLTPYEPRLIQGAKIASPVTETEIHNQAGIATYIIDEMEPNIVYIICPGTTTRTIADLLDEQKTLLGVDLFLNKKLIEKDVNEQQILNSIKGKKAKIIVTPIGGQGFIFGRGNQQISHHVIRQVGSENIIIIATKQKLASLKSLKVDTGEPELDTVLRGYIRVIADYREEHVVRVE